MTLETVAVDPPAYLATSMMFVISLCSTDNFS
jgi:hypothetical protein